MKKLLAFLLFVVLLLPQSVFAVSISVSNYPSSIGSDPFSVDVSVLGASAGQNYLRAELYKDGTSNYFGETYNGSSWNKSSDGTQYLPITMLDSKTTASATLQVRIGTPTSGEYPGPGSYKLKIKRYTSSGNAASSDEESSVDISINYSLPSSPTPTPKPASSSSSSSSTKTTSVKTSTPTPTKATTNVSSSTTTTSNATQNTNNSAKITSDNSKIASDFAKVQNISKEPSEANEVAVLGTKTHDFSFVPVALGLLLFLIAVGFFVYKNIELVKSWILKE